MKASGGADGRPPVCLSVRLSSSLLQLLLISLQLRQEAGVWIDLVTSRLHFLQCIGQRQSAVFHQVGNADSGRAAASILAVDDAASSTVRLFLDGVGTAVEVSVQVLIGVVVHGDLKLGDSGGGGKRLLLGHVDAERHRLLLEELVAAG